MRKYKLLEESLPVWLRPRHLSENKGCVEYAGTNSRVQVYIGNQGAGRSEGLTACFVDEASYVADLEAILRGVEPGVESSRGWIVVASSVGKEEERPVSLEAFRTLYYASRANHTKYTPLFLDPFERPDRDAEWWGREERTHRHVPGYMAKEYPRNAEEAFGQSGGLVFPSLKRSDDHFISREVADEILVRPGVQFYRGIDFGHTKKSAFVCVWVAHDDSGPPRLLFLDGCDEVLCSERGARAQPNGLDELLNYRRDPVSCKLEKKNDNVADALRYVVTMFRMRGTVLVYRLLFVRQDDDFQVSPVDLFRRVIERSGFAPVDDSGKTWHRTNRAEDYAATVCDRTATGWIRLLRDQRAPLGFSIDAVPYERPEEYTRDEREQGVVHLKALLMGESPWEIRQEQTAETVSRERYRKGLPASDLNEQTRFTLWRAAEVARTAREEEQSYQDGEGEWAGMCVEKTHVVAARTRSERSMERVFRLPELRRYAG